MRGKIRRNSSASKSGTDTKRQKMEEVRMAGQFEGKVALVTGSGNGIGRATALAFAREQAKVVVSDIDVGAAEETVRLIQALGAAATFVKADVAEESDIRALVEATVKAYGSLDCAVNNAGIEGQVAAYQLPGKRPCHLAFRIENRHVREGLFERKVVLAT